MKSGGTGHIEPSANSRPTEETTRKVACPLSCIWDIRYIDAPILRDENTDPNSDWDCDDDRVYYCTDANMNVTSLVNSNGLMVERYVYDPYGKATIYNWDWSSTVAWNSSKETKGSGAFCMLHGGGRCVSVGSCRGH